MKKPKKEKPKPRKVWEINPKSRVEPNKKKYSRPDEKKKLKQVTDKLNWFGEK